MLTLYTKPGCVPCREAKKILTDRGITFFENDLSQPEVREHFVAAFPNIKQAPAIFEDGEYIGGYSELRDRFLTEISSEAQLLEE
jgi:glutaredoxin